MEQVTWEGVLGGEFGEAVLALEEIIHFLVLDKKEKLPRLFFCLFFCLPGLFLACFLYN